MPRYVVAQGDEAGPLLVSPLGGVLIFDSATKAGSVAMRHGPAWVLSLHACAYYRAPRPPIDDSEAK